MCSSDLVLIYFHLRFLVVFLNFLLQIRYFAVVLTVADSLDAATDNIGRCYNRAKPLRTLVGELQAQSGTRYAPDVVALFRDETFCKVLAQKLDAERKKVYLHAYHAAE